MTDSTPTPSPVPDSCQSCPNRKRDTAQGKIAAYVFALAVSVFLGYQCITHDRKNEDVPPLTWIACFGLISGALGVQIDPASITAIASSFTKGSG